jgi:glycosyltransferase involved in cell wall biosynthesis
MKIAFHTNTLNYRGTTVAISDYAKYNQELLDNESVILYNASLGYEKDMGSETTVVEALKKQYNVVGYRQGDLAGVLEKEGVALAYFISAGHRETLPGVCKTAVHAVFQYNEPYGDRYAYISKWLSEQMSGGEHPFVPHIVHLPQPTGTYREKLGIRDDQIVIGRLGGYFTFDIDNVKQYITKLVQDNDKFVFLFVGTEPFINHPNVKFIGEIHDLQKKANFISTCDTMLHARQRGESFGLSIAEFLYLNKPVIAWNGGHDKHHIEMLKDTKTLYTTIADLNYILHNIRDIKYDWQDIVAEYAPTTVMQKFNEVFIK